MSTRLRFSYSDIHQTIADGVQKIIAVTFSSMLFWQSVVVLFQLGSSELILKNQSPFHLLDIIQTNHHLMSHIKFNGLRASKYDHW